MGGSQSAGCHRKIYRCGVARDVGITRRVDGDVRSGIGIAAAAKKSRVKQVTARRVQLRNERVWEPAQCRLESVSYGEVSRVGPTNDISITCSIQCDASTSV